MAKTEFPALLAALLERAKPGELMAAAFRTCGLVPVNKEEVIKNLPRLNQADATANRRLLDETFGERLQALRGVDQPKKKQRGKKVAPGKSFTAPDSSSSEEDADNLLMSEVEDRVEDRVEEDSEEEIVRPTTKRIRATVPVETSSDSEADPVAGPSGCSKPASTRVKSKNASLYRSQQEEFAVGSFVVAMYEGTWYVGQVEGEEPDQEVEGFTLVKYMEKKGENRFYFSQKDLLRTLNSDILLRIDPPIPVTNRGFWGLPQDILKKVGQLVKAWFILKLGSFLLSNFPILAIQNQYLYFHLHKAVYFYESLISINHFFLLFNRSITITIKMLNICDYLLCIMFFWTKI